jgi:hypothetical protein
MTRVITFLLAFICLNNAFSQCDSVTVNSDLTVSSDVLMSGVYVVNGTFTLQTGVTVYVTPYGNGVCGALKIYAENIVIDGIINGDFAGFTGGTGGSKGLSVSSITGHATSLTTCGDSGTEGHVSIEGGFGGTNGNGPGAGNGGNDAGDGSGSKQYCGNFGDEAGLIGGAGGAGGGAGGSYGGEAGNGSIGGSGTNMSTVSNLDVENSYGAAAGNGGSGGIASSVYGTETGRDIQLGSGGAGAGGGGRSFYFGTDGSLGGNGGGLIFLKATNSLTITGAISVNGQDGSYGGSGGSGDATDDCCSDGCNDCAERTFSCGSGSGAGSGAGSGGGIFLEAIGTATVTGTLQANGGDGGSTGQKGIGANCTYGSSGFCSGNSMSTSDGNTGGQGGAGSGGRIKVFVAECLQVNLNGIIEVQGGLGINSGEDGTYAEVYGYLSVTENENDLNWLIYPNPFTNDIQILISDQVTHQNSTVTVVNSLGKLVYSEELFGNTTKINLSQLDSGIYFINVNVDGVSAIKKVIKR